MPQVTGVKSFTSTVVVLVCTGCQCEIEDGTFMCSYGCRHDGEALLYRRGSVVKRTYERTDVLIKEERL